jgi:cysteine-rich repeat protein
MKTRLAACSVALVIVISACKVYNPSLAASAAKTTLPANAGADGQGDASAGLASADASGPFDPQRCSSGDCWWSRSNPDSCRMAAVPGPADRPKAPDDGGASMPDIYVGWTQIRIGATRPDGSQAADAWQSIGFDLDGVCTNSATCKGPQNALSCHPATAQVPYDGELCRDNAFASLQQLVAAVPEVGTRFGISEDALNCNLWRGTYTVVLKISGYNGQVDDSQVRVDYYASPGLERPPAWQCPQDGFRSKYPMWRTSSEWHVDSSALMQPIAAPGSLPNSNVADANAYVHDGYLVAQLPADTTLRLAGDANPYRGLAIKTQQALLVGNLYRAQDATWHIRDGLAAGRIRSSDLITTFREVGLCEGDASLNAFYGSLVEYATDDADVLADGSNDPARGCDAISMGIAFEAAQITPGTASDLVPLVECCKPGVAFEDCTPKCGDGRVNGDEKCDTGIASGQPGACPKSCPALNSCTPQSVKGTLCAAECVPKPITEVGAHDGCCPPGANMTADPDCVATCGNKVVEPGETCDPPSDCPVCPTNNACLMVTSSGSAQTCTASCQVTQITACKNGDGCCPASCTRSNDSDCSKSCGNGVLDPGETCENNGGNLCRTSCDDGKGCTTDIKTGSAANCNVVCTSIAITTPRNGDGCCPPIGANANSDNDCVPMCGNMKLEGDEECDDGNLTSGDGCSATCKVESPAQICLANIGADNECSHCNCDKCLGPALACFIANDRNEALQCRAVLSCGLDTNCRSDQCYCGTSGFGCLLGQANGPCKAPIEAAARSSVFNDILARTTDNNYPIGRAYALTTCALNNCSKECGL